jgi:hypothetical protein
MSVFADKMIAVFSFASVVWLMKHGHILTSEQHKSCHFQLNRASSPSIEMRASVAEIDMLYKGFTIG